ncbi:MAG: methyltransferase domain-containing protein [Bacteroidia bacterium]|nr:methyltransferase domain-containing protein [Bacteroidia bacterium]
MIRSLLHPVYVQAHRLLYRSRRWNPLFRRQYGAGPVAEGHISDEHLADPALDDALEQAFAEMGIEVRPYRIGLPAYRAYLADAQYPRSYYGGGLDPGANFTEKTLEHFVSAQLLGLKPGQVFVDIAAASSPFSDIAKRLFGLAESYRQDLIYPEGIEGNRIGGWAHALHLPDRSVHAATLHCSLEHFEGDSDTRLFQELARVLAPGGKAVILPFYLAHTYTIHVDPAFNLLQGHRPQLDPAAALRYCSWRQFFSRHYDPAALKRRILDPAPGLRLTLYRPENFRDADPAGYLRWAGVFEQAG